MPYRQKMVMCLWEEAVCKNLTSVAYCVTVPSLSFLGIVEESNARISSVTQRGLKNCLCFTLFH